jgi:hypothetical protein
MSHWLSHLNKQQLLLSLPKTVDFYQSGLHCPIGQMNEP